MDAYDENRAEMAKMQLPPELRFTPVNNPFNIEFKSLSDALSSVIHTKHQMLRSSAKTIAVAGRQSIFLNSIPTRSSSFIASPAQSQSSRLNARKNREFETIFKFNSEEEMNKYTAAQKRQAPPPAKKQYTSTNILATKSFGPHPSRQYARQIFPAATPSQKNKSKSAVQIIPESAFSTYLPSTIFANKNLQRRKSYFQSRFGVLEEEVDDRYIYPSAVRVETLPKNLSPSFVDSLNILKQKIAFVISSPSANKPGSRHIDHSILQMLMMLLDELNEPFIPEGFELSGKELAMATKVAQEAESLLQTQLFRNIDFTPVRLDDAIKKGQVGRMLPLPKNKFSPEFGSTTPTFASNVLGGRSSLLKQRSARNPVPVPRFKNSNSSKTPNKEPANASGSRQMPLVVPFLKVKKLGQGVNVNPLSKNTKPGRSNSQKGIYGIDIEEFDPAATFFYRDSTGKYNSHERYSNAMKEHLSKIKPRR